MHVADFIGDAEVTIELLVAGQSDLQAKVDYLHDAIKRREARDQTVRVAISSATDAKRKLVESVWCAICPQFGPCN